MGNVLAFVVLIAMLIGYVVWDRYDSAKREREQAEAEMRMWQAFQKSFNGDEEER